MEECHFSATLPKVTYIHGCFSCFLNCTNATKWRGSQYQWPKTFFKICNRDTSTQVFALRHWKHKVGCSTVFKTPLNRFVKWNDERAFWKFSYIKQTTQLINDRPKWLWIFIIPKLIFPQVHYFQKINLNFQIETQYSMSVIKMKLHCKNYWKITLFIYETIPNIWSKKNFSRLQETLPPGPKT